MNDLVSAETDAGLELAWQVGSAMFERDFASQALGMHILSIAPGTACLRMSVRRNMLNGQGSCHGGIIFMLADSTFAYACNSRNQVTVAAGCSIEFLLPVREGEVLTATARELSVSGRSGVYEITIVNSAGAVAALFFGKSRSRPDAVLTALTMARET